MGIFKCFLVVVVAYAVLEVVVAQNRGSVRYGYSEPGYDSDKREPDTVEVPRRSISRRQRPQSPPTESEEVPLIYQPPSEIRGTTGRRVPQRPPQDSYSDAAPQTIPIPKDEPPHFSPAIEAEPHAESPDANLQGRRRRQKKRRKILKDQIEKTDSEKEKEIAMSGHRSADVPNTYDIVPTADEDKPSYPRSVNERHIDSPQYYEPQTGTNRLPVGSRESVPSTGFSDSPVVRPPVHEVSNLRYIPSQGTNVHDGAYVPILEPGRPPSNSVHRLPPEEYSEPENSPFVPTYNSNPPIQTNPDPALRSTIVRRPHNSLHRTESNSPDKAHSEVRLPLSEPPTELVKNYDSQPNFVALDEDSRKNLRSHDQQSQPLNRLRNPSTVTHRGDYPRYLSNEENSDVPERRTPQRNLRNNAASAQRQPSVEPQKNPDTNSANRQSSRYQAPLQRAGSRYKPDNSLTGDKATEEVPADVPPKSRYQPERSSGTRERSRYQSESAVTEPLRTRTRAPTRYQPDTNKDESTRTRDTSTTQTRTRGSQRYDNNLPGNDPTLNLRRQNNEPKREEDTQNEPVRRVPPRRRIPMPQAPKEVENVAIYQPELPTVDEPTKLRDRIPQHVSRNTQRYQTQPSQSHSRVHSNMPPIHPEPIESTYYESEEDTLPQRTPIASDAGEIDRSPYDPIPSYKDEGHSAPVRSIRTNPQFVPRHTESYGDTHADPNEYEQDPTPTQSQRKVPNQRITPVRQSSPVHNNARVQQAQPVQDTRVPPRTRHREPYQPPPQTNRHERPQTPRTRSQSPSRQSDGTRFACPDAYGFFADPVQCDKYYECRNGSAVENLCQDGLAFNLMSAPKYLRCDSFRDVDCTERPELQEAQSTKHCPRKYGLFPHETDCTKFWNCVDGSATEVQCPPGLSYNDERATCDWADLVKSSCKTEDLLGFSCPEPTAFDLQDGVYTRYAHPDNCQLHFTCIKGEDGLRRPRMLSCTDGLVFDPNTATCTRPENVPGCEDFYGVRSPPPNRKPSRNQYPPAEEEEEEIVERTTARPRRVPTRRARN